MVKEFVEYLVTRGIESVNNDLDMSEPVRKGSCEGFRIGRDLEYPGGYTKKLEEYKLLLLELDRQMATIPQGNLTPEEELYWYYRGIILQLEFMYERLRVFIGGPDV